MKEDLRIISDLLTVLEIMTAVGVAVYLFYLGEYILSLISVIIFTKLFIFHFIMEFFDKQEIKKLTKPKHLK